MGIRRRWAAGGGLLMVLSVLACACPAGAAGRVDRQAVLEPAQAGLALQVTGSFGPDLADRVRRWLDRHPDTRVLVVDSPGGMRWQALRLADLVNARGITVRVDGRCASACALLWAAADVREMNAGARLGLHRSRLRSALPLPPPLRQLITAYNERKSSRVLRAAGFPERLIQQRRHTAPTRMSWYDADELLVAGVPFTLHEARGDGGPSAAAGAAPHATVLGGEVPGPGHVGS